MAEALHLPEHYFQDKFRNPLLTLRPIHYTAEESKPDEGVLGAGAHTDWGFLTYLITDTTPGLQLQYKGMPEISTISGMVGQAFTALPSISQHAPWSGHMQLSA